MKTFLALGVLCLLFCLAWVQEKPVRTTCTYYVFCVFVKKDLFGDGVLVRPQELTLGIGCPVTNELQDGFELQYLVRYCGIKKMVFETYTRYECSLYYRRHNGSVYRPELEFPLTCIVYRKQSFQNPVVSFPISRPMSDQENVAKRTEHSVSRPTYGKPNPYPLPRKNLLENPKLPQGTRGLLLISHLMSVVILWKQGQQPCPGINCHQVPSGIRRAKNFSLSDLGQRRLRVPCSLDSDGLIFFPLPVIDQGSSASTMRDGITGLFFWVPFLGSEFFHTLVLSFICHHLFWYGDIGLVVS